jgi:hypothetical protein
MIERTGDIKLPADNDNKDSVIRNLAYFYRTKLVKVFDFVLALQEQQGHLRDEILLKPGRSFCHPP